MPLRIIRNNIADVKADAIVNTANPCVAIGSGVDRAIHEKAGAELFEARRKIGVMEPGQAAITPAFNLNAKYVIHTVSPAWFGGNQSESEILELCYENALQLATKYKCKSIAFPLLATGNYEYPKDLALQVATNTIGRFLLNCDLSYEPVVYLVVFDPTSYQLSSKLMQDIESFIDENCVMKLQETEYCLDPEWEPEVSEIRYSMPSSKSTSPSFAKQSKQKKEPAPIYIRSLDDIQNELEETFTEALLRMIDERDMTDPEVYRRANVDRKLFSKIRTDKYYTPRKTTAIAFAIALKLNLDETKDLLSKAGYALSRSNVKDIVAEYYISNGLYNIFDYEATLFELEKKMKTK